MGEPQRRFDPSESAWASAFWEPPADVVVTDDAVIVRVELAGVAARDIQVQAGETELSVAGLRREWSGPRPRRIDCMEIARGRFQRTIPLPAAVDARDAVGRLAEGLLEVVLPLAEQPEHPAEGLVLVVIRGLGHS